MAVNQQDITEHLKNAPKHPGGRPCTYNAQVLRKTKEYIKHTTDKIPTVAGLCVHLGVPRRTLYDWLKRSDTGELSHTIELMAEKREQILLENGLDGKFNSNITKLILTTNHGYSENNQKDTAITVNVDRGRVSITSKDHAISVDTEKDITPGHVIEHE